MSWGWGPGSTWAMHPVKLADTCNYLGQPETLSLSLSRLTLMAIRQPYVCLHCNLQTPAVDYKLQTDWDMENWR